MTNEKTPATPRLEVGYINQNGDFVSIGDFADGPNGRVSAEKAVRQAYEQNHFLENQIERDPSNAHRPGHIPHPWQGALIDQDKIVRRFADGQTQELTRIPGREDEYPRTLAHAQAIEASRTLDFLRASSLRHGPVSRPLTRQEERAAWLNESGTQEQREAMAQSILDKIPELSAKASAKPAGPGSLMGSGQSVRVEQRPRSIDGPSM